jgi:tRNA A-37 threonylcarbamoyl transferase component Bud32
MADLTGMTLGSYRIVERIGRGGMAAVYKAHHAAIDRYVALKVLSADFADHPGFRARFEREARVVAKLQHPHILPIFDYGQEQGISYLVMPYIPTGTLKDYLRQEGPLPLRRVARIFRQLAKALDYAHEEGVLHRDIKPGNILFDRRGNPLLTDFGLTRMAEGSSSLTGSGVIGTPDYMSPEQGQGMPADRRSDQYSIGVVLYEMVTGQVPFSADTPVAVIFKHVSAPLPLPRNLRPDLPEAAQDVILKGLSKDPDQRYPTCVKFASAFAKAVSRRPFPHMPARRAKTQSTPIPPARTGFATRQPPGTGGIPIWMWAVGLIAVLGIIVVVLATGLLSPDGEDDSSRAALIGATDTLAWPPTHTAPPVQVTATASPSLVPASVTATLSPVPPTPTQPAATPVSVSPTALPEPTVRYPDGQPVQLHYDRYGFYLWNGGDDPIWASNIAFEALDESGETLPYSFQGSRWARFWHSIESGKCAAIELIDAPSLQRPTLCLDFNAVSNPESTDRFVFWTAHDGISQFRVLWNDEEIARCALDSGFCELWLPADD